jgi:ribonuclease G
MKREIIVNSTLTETRIGVLEEGTLVEFLIDDSKNRSIAGNIYKGRVLKILPGMQAAFVDIGLARDAFLYVRDIWEEVEAYEHFLAMGEENGRTEEEADRLEGERAREEGAAEVNDLEEGPSDRPARPRRGRRPQASIEDLIKEGQEVLVQVAREPLGTKGARITTRITLPGRYLVYMPTESHVGVSRKVEDETERARLRQIIEEINPQREGVIVRTAGMGRSAAEIGADLEFLRTLWRKIRARGETVTAPTLVNRELDLTFRIFRDLFGHEVKRLVVDSPTEYERCLEFAESLFPDLKHHLHLYESDDPIFKTFGIEREIEKALRRKVWLKSGGYLVIEETEALVSVDINTGKYVGKQDFDETILKTNLEAACEVARQVRLRDLGGIIIIDFIDMTRQEHRDQVMAELKEALKADRSPTNVSLLSELGLVEMTRKRVKQGLTKALSQTCGHCGGLGWVRSTSSLAHQALREAEWRMLRKRLPRLKIRGDPAVVEYLRVEEAEAIEQLQESYGCEVTLLPDPSYTSGKIAILEG